MKATPKKSKANISKDRTLQGREWLPSARRYLGRARYRAFRRLSMIGCRFVFPGIVGEFSQMLPEECDKYVAGIEKWLDGEIDKHYGERPKRRAA